jgi:hypothetical protein
MKRRWSTTNIKSKEYILEVLDRAVANHKFFTATITWGNSYLDAYEYRPYQGLGPGAGYWHIVGKPVTAHYNSGKLPVRKMTKESFRTALTKNWSKILELETW